MGADPGTLAIVAGGVKGLSTYSAGKVNSDISAYNAKVQAGLAKDAEARGVETERRLRLRTRQVIGAQRAGLAAQGIDINSGTALDVQADAAYVGELDALTARNNAELEAYGFKVQEQAYKMQGALDKQGGLLGGIGDILSGYTESLKLT